MKELSKEDQERNWTEDSVMTPGDKEWSNGYAKGYLDGRNKGFNEALEEALDVLKPYFSIYATTNKVSWLDVIKALDKIKK